MYRHNILQYLRMLDSTSSKNLCHFAEKTTSTVSILMSVYPIMLVYSIWRPGRLDLAVGQRKEVCGLSEHQNRLLRRSYSCSTECLSPVRNWTSTASYTPNLSLWRFSVCASDSHLIWGTHIWNMEQQRWACVYVCLIRHILLRTHTDSCFISTVSSTPLKLFCYAIAAYPP